MHENYSCSKHTRNIYRISHCLPPRARAAAALVVTLTVVRTLDHFVLTCIALVVCSIVVIVVLVAPLRRCEPGEHVTEYNTIQNILVTQVKPATSC